MRYKGTWIYRQYRRTSLTVQKLCSLMHALSQGLVGTLPKPAKVVIAASLIPPDSVLSLARYIIIHAFLLNSLHVDFDSLVLIGEANLSALCNTAEVFQV